MKTAFARVSATRPVRLAFGAWIAAVGALFSSLSACPFCTALRPTLVEQRDGAEVAALGEAIEDGDKTIALVVRQTLSGGELCPVDSRVTASANRAMRQGALAILLGDKSDAAADNSLSWRAIGATETSFAYFAQAPSGRTPQFERLAYFAKYLQHADETIAEDAYQEFGHADYADVRRAAEKFDFAKLREWLSDAQIPQDRKGFFAIALSMTDDAAEKRKNAAALRKVVDAEASEFRAGFDGVLASYVVLEGEAGLELIEKKYLANAKAAHGDVRHAIAALRFYFETHQELPAERLRQAMRHLLDRPEFAAEAIADLSRWEDWESIDRVAALYSAADYPQPATGRSVVGFLSACPKKSAADALKRLRQRDPTGVAAAESQFLDFPAAPR